jgi:tetratricopeptide (TPR) repeat protein
MELLAVAGSGSNGEVIEKGKIAFEADPENPYVLDRMTGAAGVSYGHLMTTASPRVFIGKSLRQTLPTCAQLPPAVSARINELSAPGADAASVARIWQALVSAGADTAGDRGEPSWGALGRIVQETLFLQTWRRAAFLRYWLGDGPEATRFVNQNLPMIGEDHPFRAFVQALGVDAYQDPPRYDDLIASVQLVDATAPARQWLDYAGRSKPKGQALYRQESQRLYAWTDGVARDVEAQFTMSNDNAWRIAIAKQLSALSPKSPYAMGILLAREWDTRKAKAVEYEKWAPGSSYLLGVLAKKYMEDDRVEDAVRCFKAYLEVAKDPWVYESLAGLHLKRGDEAGWLASLEAYLRDSEDFGLSHAKVRVDIARGLMSRGKYHQALPYAQAAAQTGAAWAIHAAAECHEGLGEFKPAAELYRESAEHYDSDCFTYWFWYVRSKDASSAGAARMVQDYVAQTKRLDRNLLTSFYLTKGDSKSAMEAFGALDDPAMTSHLGLHLALAADAAGDAALRDKALEQVATQPRSARTRDYFISLAKLFQAALAAPKPELDLNAVSQLIDKHEPSTRLYLNEMTGRFLLNRGEKRDAMRYLRAAIQGSTMSGPEFNLAWAALVQLGLDPRTLREPVKD